MNPEDVPEWLLELVKEHEGYVANGYVQCFCGWNDYGDEECGYNAHLLALVIPDLTENFVAKASTGWASTDGSDSNFGLGRVRRYTVGEIKQELLRRLNDGEL